MLKSQTFSPWSICYQQNPHAHFRLFCFPHAGAGPPFFRDWHKSLPPSIELHAIQLPGHGSRLKEPPIKDMSTLATEAVVGLKPYLDKPFALMGHSLGGWICFEIARCLRRQAEPTPEHLFVASCRAPQLPLLSPPSYLLSDNDFAKRMRAGNGTPKAILNNEKLMRMFLPILKADAELGETYAYKHEQPLTIPISAFGGQLDNSVTEAEMLAWREQTQLGFTFEMHSGDHFFVSHRPDSFLNSISQKLEAMLPVST